MPVAAGDGMGCDGILCDERTCGARPAEGFQFVRTWWNSIVSIIIFGPPQSLFYARCSVQGSAQCSLYLLGCPCVRPSSLMSIRSNRRIQRRISRFAFKGIIIKKSSFSLPRCGESNKNADDDELDWLMWTMMMMVKKGNHPLWRNATLMNTRQRRNRLLILEIIPNYD